MHAGSLTKRVLSMQSRRATASVCYRRVRVTLKVIAFCGLAIGYGSLPARSDAMRSGNCEPNAQAHKYEKSPAPYAPTTSSEIVHISIDGRDFYVPRNYFRHPPIGCGASETGMLLRVLLPELMPYSEATKDKFSAQRGWDMQMNILLTSDPPIRPFAELIDIYLTAREVEVPTEKTYHLYHGLHAAGDDIYYSKEAGQIVRLIQCGPWKPHQTPSCRHRFRYEAYDVQLTYGRQHLPDWRSIQNSTKKLLSGFIAPQK